MRWRAASSNSGEAGTQLAVRPEPPSEPETRRLGLRERSRLRRRVRFLRKRRELELRDLGGLIFDMYRFGSKRQDLVRDKLQDMFAADRELREFEHLLDRRQRRLDLREAGVGGACPRCQQLYSTEARFCSRCGESLADGARRDVVVGPQTARREGSSFYEPHTPPVAEAEAPGWPRAEPRTHTWPQPEPAAAGSEPADVELDREPADGAVDEPSAEPQPFGAREPQRHTWPPPQQPEPQTRAWPQPEPQPQASWGPIRGAPRPAPTPAGDPGGRRSPFRRRRRKSPPPGAHAAEEARRQTQSWEAQYQASVEAQRRAWAAESQAQRPGGDAGNPSGGAEHQDVANQDDFAAGSGEGASGLESGDPLASRHPDPPR